ncbi:hypothetical protein AB0H12_19115 [Actinosynnema sp. NPDC023794]
MALKRWKVYLVLSLVLLIGLIVLMVHSAVERSWVVFDEPWRSVPWDSIGEPFLGAFLVGSIYEGLIRRQSEALLNDTIRRSLEEEREGVLRGLTVDAVTNPAALSRLSVTELTNATKAVLAARLGEESLARDVSDSLIPQAAPNIELTRDFQTRVQFLEDGDLPEEPGRYFTARIAVSYVRRLRRAHLKFGATDSAGAIMGRIGTPGDYDVFWHTNRMSRYTYQDARSFALEYVRVNDEDLRIAVTHEVTPLPSGEEVGVLAHTASSAVMEHLVGSEVRVAYCYVVEVPKLGHLLHFPIAQTSDGVRYEFDLGDVGIARATVVPFFLSASKPLVREQDFRGRTVITAATTSWVLPGGGIALTWKLVEETGAAFVQAVHRLTDGGGSG